MEMAEKERKDAKMSTLHEVRLMADADEKEAYAKDEILKLLDTIARSKETE